MSTSELQPQELIANRWRIIKMVAKGGFSTVFEVQDEKTKEICALKIEPTVDRVETVTKIETAILLRLRGETRHVCAFIGCGRVVNRFNFIAMTLVGPNFDELRRQCSDGRMEAATVLRLAVQCVESIEALHNVGFLHRDVKPGNFAIGRTNDDRRTVYLLDFGLARLYRKEGSENEMRPARESVGFRGTLRYCSFSAHYNADLGRHDDFWSLFYVLIELRTGVLPWRALDDQVTVGRMKRTIELGELICEKIDKEIFGPIDHELRKLRYADKPDYKWFYDHFARIQRTYKLRTDGPFEWEEEFTVATATD